MQNGPNRERLDRFEELPMRVAWGHIRNPDEALLRYAKQLGVNDVLLTYLDVQGERRSFEWASGDEFTVVSFEELNHVRNRIEDAGLRLAGLDSLPNQLWDRIIFGKEGRDAQLEALKETVRNMGRAGIPILGYHWYDGSRRTTSSYRIRGGALATAYDHKEGKRFPTTQDREYTEEELWDNFEHFVEEIVPVAEEAGVRLALHPTDPPIGDIDTGLGGTPYLFRHEGAFSRALDLHDSPHHGLKFCFGCFSQMANTDVYEAIKRFSDRIHHVHFRDVSGTVPKFHEEFIDTGDHDPLKAIETLDSVGFNGPITPDHVPRVEGDTDRQHRAYAYTIGFMQAALQATGIESG